MRGREEREGGGGEGGRGRGVEKRIKFLIWRGGGGGGERKIRKEEMKSTFKINNLQITNIKTYTYKYLNL